MKSAGSIFPPFCNKFMQTFIAPRLPPLIAKSMSCTVISNVSRVVLVDISKSPSVVVIKGTSSVNFRKSLQLLSPLTG